MQTCKLARERASTQKLEPKSLSQIVPLDVLGELCEAMDELLVTVEIRRQMPHQNCQYPLCIRREEGPKRCSEVMRGAGSVL